MSEEEVQEETLVGQLGSAGQFLDDDEFDYRILSVLRSTTETPDTFRPALFACMYDDIVTRKMRFATAFKRNVLPLYVSIGGRGRRDLIYGEQVKRGAAVSIGKEIQPPGALDKLFNRRKVDAYERQEAERLDLE